MGPGAGHNVNATKDVFRFGPRQVPTTLRGQSIQACVICQAEQQQEVEAFLKELADGLEAHKGLAKSWKLPKLQWHVFSATTGDAADYQRAVRKALDSDTAWDLAFVQTPDNSKDTNGDSSPYLVTKAKLLAHAVPVQEFRDETMRKPKESRQWILGGIALQVFTKLGGIPWLLRASRSDAHEIIIGLGSAQLGVGRFGQRERIVGLATAFSGDGTYWLTEASRAVPFEEHEDALGETAVAAIGKVRREMNWRPGDVVRVIFHSFKDFRGGHVTRIQKTLDELRTEGYVVEVAFLHVVEHHSFLLFNEKNNQKIPPRGIMVDLGNDQALLSLMGPSEVRRSESGFPYPVLVKLHSASTFKDLGYLSEQVLAFAAHSWRNFPPTSLPVTIKYSGLIADLLGRLGTLSRWDPDVLRGLVGTTRWFL